jgi:hypothetical protein
MPLIVISAIVLVVVLTTTAVTPLVYAGPGCASFFELSRATTHEMIFTGTWEVDSTASAGPIVTRTPKIARVEIFIDHSPKESRVEKRERENLRRRRCKDGN